mgnify:CR=1 FL=1
METSSRRRNSNIVLALDFLESHKEKLLRKSLNLLEELSELICAIKINRHLVLPLGLFDGVTKIVDRTHDLEIPVIMDCKINDISSTNLVIAENYFKAGFDGITVNPTVGWEDGLKPVFKLAHRLSKGIITVVYMSHKGAQEFYEQKILEGVGKHSFQYEVFARKTLEWQADGAVVGATKPDKIQEINKILGGKVPIYSPGVGFQGGKIEEALISGAKFLIVGRTIINSKKPVEVTERIRETVLKTLKKISG